MTIRFYDALQLDPSVLKGEIRSCSKIKDKIYYWSAIAVRSILIVSFAVLFISLLSAIFGEDNTPLAVVLLCILLGIRFVNFGYCITDSLITLAVALSVLVAAPCAAAICPAGFLIPLHFAAFFSLLYMTSQHPEMGNAGLYSFAYVYLTGNPVEGESFTYRILMALAGYLVCGVIMFIKHRNKHKAVRFRKVIHNFDISSSVHIWQLRMALGVSLILTAGQLFSIERFMWMGFACASLLSEYPYSHNTTVRFRQRIEGVIAGSAAFAVIYMMLPKPFHFILGPLGGLCLGFCTDYKYKTALNCFGALMLGTGVYGLQGAVLLRIADTVLGVTFGTIFASVFHRVISIRFLPRPEEKIQMENI